MSPSTLPALLRHNAATRGSQPAIREKRHGIWETLSWAEYAALVQRFARGLAAHGFGPGDRLAVMGDNRSRLYAALLGAQTLGGIGVPLWPDAEPDAIAAVLRRANVRVVVTEDHAQLQKLLSVKDELPSVRLAVALDPRDLRQCSDAWLIDFATIEKQSGAAADRDQPHEPALLLYGAERVGGVVLTHANLLAAARAVTANETVRPDDNALCWIPMAWIGDALYLTALGLLVGFACNCPERPETAWRDLREIGPNFLVGPPSLWEELIERLEDRVANASWLKRASVTWALSQQHRVAEWLVRRPMSDRLGLARVRWAHTGGTPVAPVVWHQARALGVNLKQSYGPVELAGFAAVQPASAAAPDTSMLPAQGMELRISAQGEVLARGDGVCPGYDGAPAARVADGWWRTGDAGELDTQGRLTVLDRIAHLGRLADGRRFVPSMVESRLRRGRLIHDALAFGNGRPFVGAIITPSRTGVAKWAAAQELAGTSPAELVANPALRAAIREEVRTCNSVLPPAMRIRRFVLLERAIDPADVEARLDRARHRRLVTAQYSDLVECLFRDSIDATEVMDENGVPLYPSVTIEEVEAAPSGWEPAHA